MQGHLRGETSGKYQGYLYEAFAFSLANGDGTLTLSSEQFDPYLIVISPSGEISTNDDHGLSASDLDQHDSAILVSSAEGGRWLAIATSYSIGSTGTFALRSEGHQGFERLSAASIDEDIVARSFAERGVLSDAALQQRQEQERQQQLEALVEQLSLSSYRRELSWQLRDALNERELRSRTARDALDELEEREANLETALREVQRLSESQELVADLLQQELDSVEASAEHSAELAARAMAEQEAFSAALDALERLAEISRELELAEEQLLHVTEGEQFIDARQKVRRLRAEGARVRRNIAEKLLDSDIVERLRFGGYRTLMPYYAEVTAQAALPSVGFAEVASVESGGAVTSSAKVKPSVWLPTMLPWPPPDASARARLNRNLFLEPQPETLGSVADRLASGLSDAGYYGPGYLGVPGGFSIVTRIEQTDAGGEPLNGRARWSATIEPMSSFSIAAYLRALLTASPGYFRVLVLVVSDEPFAESGARARLSTLERWSRQGLNALPQEVRAAPYRPAHQITALVYEFEKQSRDDDVQVHIPGRLTASEHLSHTRFANYLL